MDDKKLLEILIRAKASKMGLDDASVDSMLGIKGKTALTEERAIAAEARAVQDQQIQLLKLQQDQDKLATDKADKEKGLTTAADAIQRGDLYTEDLGPSKSLVLDILNKRGIKPKTKPPVADATREKAKIEASRIVNDLENQYFGEGDVPQLAYGRGKGFMETIKSMAGANADLNSYEATRKSVRPKLVKAMGDTGNFSQSEQEAAVSDIPTGFNTPEEAVKYFRNVYTKLGVPVTPKIQRLYDQYKGKGSSSLKHGKYEVTVE